MREVSFVNKLKFNFPGSVTKRALVIGDADNDQVDIQLVLVLEKCARMMPIR